MQQAFVVVQEMWAPTIERARRLPPPLLHERVNGEYSFVETFRHLLFAWDSWLRGVLRLPDGYHEWAVPPDFDDRGTSRAGAGRAAVWSAGVGWSSCDVAPELDPVLEVRADRMTRVRDYLSGATDEDLMTAVTTPPYHPKTEPVLYCFRVVLHDEWWHHQYAIRDLAVLER